jgi:hypothetical protein
MIINHFLEQLEESDSQDQNILLNGYLKFHFFSLHYMTCLIWKW